MVIEAGQWVTYWYADRMYTGYVVREVPALNAVEVKRTLIMQDTGWQPMSKLPMTIERNKITPAGDFLENEDFSSILPVSVDTDDKTWFMELHQKIKDGDRNVSI